MIVVTGVPLASSCHLKFEPFTLAVAGAVLPGDGDAADGDGDAGAVGDAATVGVVAAVGLGLALPGAGPLFVHEVTPNSRAVVSTNPRVLM